MRPKIGLALGSGGAKGLCHIGVLKTLEKYEIPIDYIAGSSIGSLIGAHYAAFQDTKRLENFFTNINVRKSFELFDFTLTGGLIKGKKFEKFIDELLEGATFHTLRIPFAAVATDFNTAQAVILTDGNLSKAIRASTSVPTLFQPLAYRDLLLADGGLSDSVPVDVVRSMGADIVIAVNLDTLSTKKGMLPTLDKIPLQSINILRHNLALQSTKTAEVIISPSGIPQIGLVGWEYFFDLKKNKDLIEAGEKAGKEGISQILESMKKSTKRKKTFFQKMISFFHKKG